MTAAIAHPLVHPTTVDSLAFDPASPVYQVLNVLVSPKLAVEILETRAPNRQIKQHRVDQYARDMRAGHWLRNGETIKFDRFGRLLDGQHRLWAVIEADVAVDFTVVLGLEPEAMATVDTGVARSFSDVLGIGGTLNTRYVAAITRVIWQFETGKWAGYTPSHFDLGATLSRFPEVIGWANDHRGERMLRLGQFTALAFTLILGARVDAEASERYYDALTSGANLDEGNPVLAMREKLIAWRGDRSTTSRAHQRYVLALCIKTWNAHLDGREIRHLRHAATEQFPAFAPPIPGLRVPAPDRKLTDKDAS